MTQHRRFQLLPQALKAAFREACQRGINPRTDCPICEGNRITVQQQHRFDHDRKDFVPSWLEVSCHRCRWTWGVTTESVAGGVS